MKVLFVHGFTASHLSDWYPQMARELTVRGIHFAIPDLPGGHHPHATEWISAIHQEIKSIREPVILVGHSLGTRAILLYLEKYPTTIQTVILVAPLGNLRENAHRKNEAYPDFFDHTIDLKAIKPRVQKFIIMHSLDDPSVPYKQGADLAKELDATLLTYKDRGHFYQPENSPYILEVLLQALSEK